MARLTKSMKAQEAKSQEYFILDKNARELGPHRLATDDQGNVTQTKIRLTDEQAAFFVAGGVISTQDPEAAAKVKAEAEKAVKPAGRAA